MTTARNELGYRLDPLDRGFLGPLSRRQVFVSAAGGLLWLLFGLFAKMMMVGFVVLGVAVVVAIPPFAGQPIVEWLPIWSGWLLRGRWARRWVRPLHLTTGGPLHTQPSLPAWLGGLRIVAHPVEHWAAIHDTAAKTLTAHLQIAGSGFSTLSTDQMHFLLAGWGQVFAAIPPEDGLVRITWSDIARRVPHVGHDEWLGTVRPDDRRLGAYRDFIASQDGVRHDLVLTVTLKVAAFRDRQSQITSMEHLKAAVTMVVDALGDARLAAYGPLASGEVAYLMRLGLDPTAIEPPGGVRPGSLVHTLGHVPIGAAGPMLTETATNHVTVDSVVHRTFWIESWPERRQPADWFEPVLSAGVDGVVQRVFTMVHEPLSEAKAVSEINRAAARHGGEHEAAVEGRTRWTAFKARRSAAVEERERELADGHVPVAYTGFVTITVSEADELRRASRTIQRRCQRHRVLIRPLWGRMELGLAAALPIGLGLSREPF
jgi:hypothetical protein